VAVGPWWHFFRRHKIAQMVYEQLCMGPISSIACGFTDARFVEMIVAKLGSLRYGLVDAVSRLIEDETSHLYGKTEEGVDLIQELLYSNPVTTHHIPVD
jgi:hypothetical protein